jgi:hypothetical protein
MRYNMFNITDEMRNTYNLPVGFDILLDYGAFVQAEWNEWSVVIIESMAYYLVK